MKRVIVFFLLISILGNIYAQESSTSSGPIIQFNETNFNFGNIIFGTETTHEFNFTNTGTSSLIISNVKSTCGCTIPVWSNDTIVPGGKGVIVVKYDSNRSGEFTKGITVYSNATNGDIVLIIEGNVTPNPNKAILGEKK